MSVVTGDTAEHGGDIDNVSVSVSEKDNVSIKDNVSATVSGEDIVSVVTGDTAGHGGVQDGGGGHDDGQPEVAADGRGESPGPGRGHGMLVVTAL